MWQWLLHLATVVFLFLWPQRSPVTGETVEKSLELLHCTWPRPTSSLSNHKKNFAWHLVCSIIHNSCTTIPGQSHLQTLHNNPQRRFSPVLPRSFSARIPLARNICNRAAGKHLCRVYSLQHCIACHLETARHEKHCFKKGCETTPLSQLVSSIRNIRVTTITQHFVLIHWPQSYFLLLLKVWITNLVN